MSMSKKFQRTRSTASTYHVSKKLLFFQDEVDEIAASTIIPYVNQRFDVVPKCRHSESKRVIKVESTESEKNRKLACSIIYFRITKMVKNLIGTQIVRRLKINVFHQKVTKIMHKKQTQILSEAIRKIKQRPRYSENKFKILFRNINYILKRVQHNQTSYAFRRIALSQNNDMEQKISRTKRKKQTFTFGSNQYFQTSIKTVKTQRQKLQEPTQLSWSKKTTLANNNVPYQLKPDRYAKKNEQIPVWRVLSHHISIENTK